VTAMKQSVSRILAFSLTCVILVACGPSQAERSAQATRTAVAEAIRRATLQQDAAGILGTALEQYEAETFAGLWLQHEPEYRVVVAFTRDGEKTIRPYVADTSLAGLIEVRPAEATYAELMAAQREAHRLLEEAGLSLGLSFSSGGNVQESRIEIYVTDRALFDATLKEVNVRLPDHVEVVTVYEPLGDDVPFAVTPEPSIHFPQLRMRTSTFMTALLVGTLVVKDGCLRASAGDSDEGYLIIWQTDYFLNNHEGVIEILDRNGQAVARVGEEIRMGGGEVPLTADLERALRAPLPEQCDGPYWLMGEIVPDPD